MRVEYDWGLYKGGLLGKRGGGKNHVSFEARVDEMSSRCWNCTHGIEMLGQGDACLLYYTDFPTSVATLVYTR